VSINSHPAVAMVNSDHVAVPAGNVASINHHACIGGIDRIALITSSIYGRMPFPVIVTGNFAGVRRGPTKRTAAIVNT